MEEKNKNEYNAEMTINEYLSLLQIEYDRETVYSLAKSLQQNGVTGFGIIPYFTLTAATILEMLSSNEIKLEIPYSARIKDIRMKLKIFEDGYSKSKRMSLAIDYLHTMSTASGSPATAFCSSCFNFSHSFRNCFSATFLLWFIVLLQRPYSLPIASSR